MAAKKEASKKGPEKVIRVGLISASIWKNRGKSREGKEMDFYSTSLQRRYRDENGEWKTAASFGVMDLPRAVLTLQKAFEYLIMKEKDDKKAK